MFTYIPSLSDFLSIEVSTEHWVGSHLHIVSIVYVYQSQLPNSSLHPLSHWVSIHLFYMSVSLCFVYKIVYTNFIRFHIYVLLYDICFSLSDLPHSVWQSLGLFMSPQMTQFCSLLWQSSVPFYMCITYLSISLLMDI